MPVTLSPVRYALNVALCQTPPSPLNNTITFPSIGLGVFQTPPEVTTAAVEEALRAGYRHIIAENFDVFDFELTAEQLTAIDALDTGVRGGPEAGFITLEAHAFPVPEA